MRQLRRVVIMPGQGLGQWFLPLLDKGRYTSQRRRGRVSQLLPGGSLRIGSGSVSPLEASILPHAHPLGAGPAPSTTAQSMLIRVIFSTLRDPRLQSSQGVELTVSCSRTAAPWNMGFASFIAVSPVPGAEPGQVDAP